MGRVSRNGALLLVAAVVSGCAMPYYWQAVKGQISLLRRRVPIERVVDDDRYDTGTRARLATVAELRRFAVNELGLPDNDSYTSFVDLGRDYVVWNVIATEEFSTEPVRWCFPVAGCVAYRGYFDKAAAERFRRKLAERGLDTYSGGSGAYSTLGYFDDPVLSTMLGGDESRVAGVLFHELAHQRVYIKGDSELSEAYATAVEEFGVERWLTERGDAAGLDAYRAARRRGREFAELVARVRRRLAAIYASDLDPAAMRAAKAEAFAAMRAEYAALKRAWGGYAQYDYWMDGDLNNATLVAVATYRQWLPGLRWRLEQIGVEAFHAEVEALAGLPVDARTARLSAWNDASAAGAQAQLR